MGPIRSAWARGKETMDPTAMKVTELRAALEKRGEPTKGLKKDLIARLQESLAKEKAGSEESVATSAPAEATQTTPQEDVAISEDKVESPVKETVESSGSALEECYGGGRHVAGPKNSWGISRIPTSSEELFEIRSKKCWGSFKNSKVFFFFSNSFNS